MGGREALFLSPISSSGTHVSILILRPMLTDPTEAVSSAPLATRPRLWVFNPGHEEALRIPLPLRYTPTSEVRQMRHDLAPLLTLLAERGDYIYRPALAPHQPAVLLDHEGHEVSVEDLRGASLEVKLWGLEPHILRELVEAPLLGGLRLQLPPITPTYLQMAHRRAAHGLLSRLVECGGYPRELLPLWVEAGATRGETRRALQQALDSQSHRVHGSREEVLVKRPFSSSGRGVLPFPRLYTERHLEALTGSCQRLGMISIEPLWPVREDWALEYERREGGFVAFSLFETQAAGRAYAGNLLLPQSTLRERLTEHLGEQALRELIDLHREYLAEALAGSDYVGYIGIDLFLYEVEGQTKLHPCVEINLRTTMGVLAHLAYERYLAPGGQGRFLIEYIPRTSALLRPEDQLLTPCDGAALFRAVLRPL